MDQPPILCQGLTKRYADFWGRARVPALTGLDLRVERGEVVGLLGPNGSGKTTTIKLLLGLCRASEGSAFVLGRDPGDRDAKRRIGYVPEETYLYRFLTADETLRFFGRLHRIPAGELGGRIDEQIARVGLAHARNRRLGEYSKGMARRLAIACALLHRPELVILDEPTSGLDPLGSAEVKDLISELKRAGTTILLCSHLLADVEDVCDKVAILYQGRLRAWGTVESLLRDDRRVTVELDRPDAATLAAVQAAAGSAFLRAGPPRERLEAVFKRVIAEARER